MKTAALNHNSIDTIAAPATAPGRGGIGIIRISGPNTQHITTELLGKIPTARVAEYHIFRDADQQAIDEGLALYFPNPHSFTGEDVLELHGHGGPVVMDMLLQRILSLGARVARPGEFSERAFLNGKLDLAQAEAIADLIDANSRQAASGAMRSLQGEFSKKVHELVEQLIHLRIYVEAAIDFPEEEIDFLADNKIHTNLQNIITTLTAVQHSAQQGALLREGLNIVIIGKPNAGKSSLLNQLSGREAAIVTDIPGTTRDVLREKIQIDGIPLHIIDTAGLRDNAEVIEQEGIRRALNEVTTADHILCVVDAEQTALDKDKLSALIPEDIKAYGAEKPLTIVANKIDLLNHTAECQQFADYALLTLSAKTGDGIDLLRQHLKTLAGADATLEGNFSARRRHLQALEAAQTHLAVGQQQLQQHQAGELLAEDLRQAQQALSEITGEFHSDDLLGRIFSSFCIGK